GRLHFRKHLRDEGAFILMPHGFSTEPYFHYAVLSMTPVSTGLLASYQGIFPQTFAFVIA
ncbi:MAG: hypothetical protein SO411_04285, partial [Bacteroidaceae bacterium]|nr:hypothetical protein [Bacteroidaceae bacterium]